MTHSPKVELSTRQIVFKPGDGQDLSREDWIASPDLAVDVINTTQQFISFQLEIEVEGQKNQNQFNWYAVEPNVCAKKPPGDRTTFYIKLLKAPVPAYDTTIPLQVKLFSAELASLSTVETVYLKILRPAKTLRVFCPFKDLRVYPGARLKIPVLVYNFAPELRAITLRLEEIDPDWFPDGVEQTIWVDAGGSQEIAFWCSPPAAASTVQGVYRLGVQATDAHGNSAGATGNYFEILPYGQLQSRVEVAEQISPDQMTVLNTAGDRGIAYEWRFENRSNVSQAIALTVNPDTLPPRSEYFAADLILAPAANGQIPFQVRARRPWLGWMRTHFIEVAPKLQHPDSDETIPEIGVNPASQVLTLKLRPRISPLLQLLAGLLGSMGGGIALWQLWFLSPTPLHQGPVNAVRLVSNGNLVVSGSSDQTLRQWQVNRAPWRPDVRRLQAQNSLEQPAHSFDKAIRAIEMLPANLRQVAIGLENGEIQLWDVDPPSLAATLQDKARFDRVFDLAFTNDSRHLFSGHGSGTVRVWASPRQQRQFNRHEQWEIEKKLYLESFAISSLAVSSDDRLVAIAGQFNRLLLWDWQSAPRTARSATSPTAYEIPYEYLRQQPAGETSSEENWIRPVISRNSYLTSVDFASKNPDIMVTADNVGVITLWDLKRLQDCMLAAQLSPSPPQPILGARLKRISANGCSPEAIISAQWQAGRQGSAIREVTLDATGCFLASTGDDGRISVWPLSRDEPSAGWFPQTRIPIAAFQNQRLNSIDIHLSGNDVLLIAADAPDHSVQLYRQQLSHHGCQ